MAIIRINKGDQTFDEWQEYRTNVLGPSGLGASEISGLFNLSKWTPLSKLYYRKIGEEIENEPSIYTYAGTFDEEVIRNRFQYYPIEGSSAKEQTLEMWENYKSKVKLRECLDDPTVWRNEDIPHLFVNLDGIDELDTPKVITEIKNTSNYAVKGHKYGVDLAYILQVQMQMLVTGIKKGGIFQRIDGTMYEYYPIEPIPHLQDEIIQRSTEFWDRVLAAREIKEEYGVETYVNTDMRDFTKKQMEGVGVLQSLEPDFNTPEDSEWLNEWLIPPQEIVEVKGSPELLDVAYERELLKDQIKEIQNEVSALDVEMKRHFQQGDYTHAMYPFEGKQLKVSWTKDRLGRGRLNVSKGLKDIYNINE